MGLLVIGLVVVVLCVPLVWIAARSVRRERGFLPSTPTGWVGAIAVGLLAVWTVIGVAGWISG